ncbi:MAG TPA: D-glycero-beta-D-manno-heptose 1-phosphate adenylyltransferase [Chloroflexia bacterium]|nr:D-glycero-beta-D-manno-heptose 1-phosphate adenylyltransferase [Chloroflexia bacterium]
MNINLPHFIDSFTRMKVLVIGEAMLDSYLEGVSERICREAPVPIVAVSERKDVPGGAANTAVNICSLGGQVTFLSVVGDDQEGKLLRQALEEKGVRTGSILTQAGRRTLAKHRVIASGQLLVRFDQGDGENISAEIEQALSDRLTELYSRSDAVVISDYGYGIFTPRIIETLKQLQALSPRVLVADSKHLPAYKEVGVTAVKPNFGELKQLLGAAEFENGADRAERIVSLADKVLEVTGAQMAACTIDIEGAVIVERSNAPYRTYARPTANSKAAGAGDTFVSALTLALAAGAQAPAAAEIASAAAAVVVSKDGTSTCSADELVEQFVGGEKFLANPARLAERLENLRRQGKKVVFTNGCFDLLHRGHINLLNRAKTLGDVLIVGLNSDDSVKRLKGPTRPINSLEDRMQVLSALSSIDYLVVFDEDQPEELIKAIQPDVVVKGGNYTPETLPEKALVEELGGTITILPYVEDHSTTGIIERIKEVLAQSGTLPEPADSEAATEAPEQSFMPEQPANWDYAAYQQDFDQAAREAL